MTDTTVTSRDPYCKELSYVVYKVQCIFAFQMISREKNREEHPVILLDLELCKP